MGQEWWGGMILVVKARARGGRSACFGFADLPPQNTSHRFITVNSRTSRAPNETRLTDKPHRARSFEENYESRQSEFLRSTGDEHPRLDRGF